MTTPDTAADAASTQTMIGQARRLWRLRKLLGLTQEEAGRLAGTGRDAWTRMESWTNLGRLARLDGVALARFLREASKLRFGGAAFSADYVISGSINGLPGNLARELVRAELAEEMEAAAEAPATEGSVPARGTGPSRSLRKKSRAGTSKPPVPVAG